MTTRTVIQIVGKSQFIVCAPRNRNCTFNHL